MLDFSVLRKSTEICNQVPKYVTRAFIYYVRTWGWVGGSENGNFPLHYVNKKSLLKGQLISKCPFGVFKSLKKPTKYFPGFLP